DRNTTRASPSRKKRARRCNDWVWPRTELARAAYCDPSGEIGLVIGAQCGRGDCCCGSCAKAGIERHRERRHGGTLGIGEHVVEHTTRHEVRVRQCITEVRNDAAATIFAGEPRTPDVCGLARNDRADTRFRPRRIFPIVTQLALETDKVAERLPEFLFERRSRYHSAVLGGIETIARRAASDVARSISRPSARNETMADRPEHQR